MRSADPKRLNLIRGGAVLWILIVVVRFYAENGDYLRQKISDFVGYALRVVAG